MSPGSFSLGKNGYLGEVESLDERMSASRTSDSGRGKRNEQGRTIVHPCSSRTRDCADRVRNLYTYRICACRQNSFAIGKILRELFGIPERQNSIWTAKSECRSELRAAPAPKCNETCPG